jgi:predicted RNA-binding Zn ribbon-like protein
MFSAGTTLALVVLALVYCSGSSARIASDYTSIASPANRALSAELAGYRANQTHDLAGARSDLMRVAKTAGSFDDQLAQVHFPGAANTAAGALTQADQKLAKLIRMQAGKPSLAKMQSFARRVDAAAATVKIQVSRIRKALGLPPSGGPLY